LLFFPFFLRICSGRLQGGTNLCSLIFRFAVQQTFPSACLEPPLLMLSFVLFPSHVRPLDQKPLFFLSPSFLHFTQVAIADRCFGLFVLYLDALVHLGFRFSPPFPGSLPLTLVPGDLRVRSSPILVLAVPVFWDLLPASLLPH